MYFCASLVQAVSSELLLYKDTST